MTSRRTALPHFSQLVTGGVACISNQDFEPSFYGTDGGQMPLYNQLPTRLSANCSAGWKGHISTRTQSYDRWDVYGCDRNGVVSSTWARLTAGVTQDGMFASSS